jgi:hypothetical protein
VALDALTRQAPIGLDGGADGDDVGAGARKCLGDRQADASPCAGDDREAIGQRERRTTLDGEGEVAHVTPRAGSR